MTNFTFTSGDNTDELTKDDSPLDSADDDTGSIAMYDSGNLVVDISDDYSRHLNILADLRYNTGSGLAKSKRGYSEDQQADVKDSSMAGEGGLHIAYDEWELDERIIENGGDGGVDGQLRLDGELRDCDVKCPTAEYDDNPWLKVRADKQTSAEVFILASYKDGRVTYHGWIDADDLLREDNRSSITGVDNYLLTDIGAGGDIEDLNEMPPLTVPSRSTGSSGGFSLLESAGD